jgi:hypothetical protein
LFSGTITKQLNETANAVWGDYDGTITATTATTTRS